MKASYQTLEEKHEKTRHLRDNDFAATEGLGSCLVSCKQIATEVL